MSCLLVEVVFLVGSGASNPGFRYIMVNGIFPKALKAGGERGPGFENLHCGVGSMQGLDRRMEMV